MSTTPANAQAPAHTDSGMESTGNINAAPQTEATWDTWLAAQPDEQRMTIETLFNAHTAGLRNALNNERESRKTMEKQLRDMAAKESAGSDAQTRLEAMAEDIAKANRRADFYEAASKPETGLSDVKAAWIIINANAEEYIDRKGSVNFELLKREHPGLFAQAKPVPRANAGTGTNQPPSPAADMNAAIRRAAGRTS